MKKETLKELGKYFLDISKILIALILVTPLMKDNEISYLAIGFIFSLFIIGVFLTNKGVKYE